MNRVRGFRASDRSGEVPLAGWTLRDVNTGAFCMLGLRRSFVVRDEYGPVSYMVRCQTARGVWSAAGDVPGRRPARPARLNCLCGEQVPETRHQVHETLFAWGVGALTGGARRRHECGGLLELVETTEHRGVRPCRVEPLAQDFGDRPA